MTGPGGPVDMWWSGPDLSPPDYVVRQVLMVTLSYVSLPDPWDNLSTCCVHSFLGCHSPAVPDRTHGPSHCPLSLPLSERPLRGSKLHLGFPFFIPQFCSLDPTTPALVLEADGCRWPQSGIPGPGLELSDPFRLQPLGGASQTQIGYYTGVCR